MSKFEAFSPALKGLEMHIAKSTKDKRKELSEQGANCLTCKKSKVALGTKLICSLKDKLVSQHNYCERFISVSPMKITAEGAKSPQHLDLNTNLNINCAKLHSENQSLNSNLNGI